MDIMLDTETWGTTPGSDIRSIGAVAFDPVAGWVGPIADNEFYIATRNPKGWYGKYRRFFEDESRWQRKYPLTRDPATVQWWSEQSDEAQAAFADPVDLREALQRFTDWLNNVGTPLTPDQPGQIRLWAHSSHFDIPILAAAYTACGLPVPWHYRAPRDTRTLFDAAGIDDHSAWLKQHPGPLGIPHHALSDAICQARAVCAAMARIRIDAPAPGWES